MFHVVSGYVHVPGRGNVIWLFLGPPVGYVCELTMGQGGYSAAYQWSGGLHTSGQVVCTPVVRWSAHTLYVLSLSQEHSSVSSVRLQCLM